MTRPCTEDNPEAHAGADVEDDWDVPATAVGRVVMPHGEVDDGRLDPGAVPGRAES